MLAGRSLFALLSALTATVGLFAYAVSAETPTGSAKGRVTVAESGEPLVGINVVLRPTHPTSGEDAVTVKTGKDGAWELLRVPAGTYEATTQTNVYTTKPQKLVVREGETAQLDLRPVPGDPFLNLYVHVHAHLPENNPRVALNGFRQGDAMALKLYTVDGAMLTRKYGGSLRKMLAPISYRSTPDSLAPLKASGAKLVRSWTHSVRKRDAEGVFYDNVKLGKLDPGVYLVEAKGQKQGAVGWLMVTDLALVTKSTPKKVLAFTVDLRTGAPVANVPLSTFVGEKPLGQRTTDASGKAEVKLNASGDQVDLVALGGNSIAFSRFYTYGEGQQQYRVVTYTDRPVYRPGHLVRFKGIVRRPEGVGYAVPSPRSVSVEVKDGSETRIFTEQYATNENGTFAGQFDLPTEAPGGSYSLEVKVDGEAHTDSFVVASYRKPEWQVDLSFPKPRYIQGDVVPVTLTGRYYYGAPVVEGKAHYTIYRAQYWSWGGDPFEDQADGGDDEASGDEGYADSYGDVVAEGDVVTDADGTAHFQFPTRLENGEDKSADYRYNVQVELTDESERAVMGEGGVIVSAGEMALHARPDKFSVKPGEPVSIEVRAQDFQGTPSVGLSVEAEANLELWDGSRSQRKEIGKGTVTTGADGKATWTLNPSERGSVAVTLSARDRRGNRITETTYLWVTTGDGEDLPARYPELAVLLDKRQYKIGETAQVLLNTDRPGATAVVAVEAEEILEYRQITLKTRSTVIPIKVKAGWEPNVFVTACFVKKGEFANSKAQLRINPDKHRVNVALEPDKESYHPGDTASIRVRTTDENGKPLPAELSLGVVDEAIYAIQADRENRLWDALYPRRQLSVNTEFSYPWVYLGDASKDGTGIAVRKNFPDTALWNPFVKTDASGQTTLQVKLPDNLTSWRVTAQAITGDTEVGEARRNFRVMKELTLRLQTPRVVTEGDAIALTAVAHNYSQGPLDITVQLQAEGLEVSGDRQRRVRLEPGKSESFSWDARATTAGNAKVTATASGGSLSDGMQMDLPVKPFAREDVVYRTGSASEETKTETLEVDPNAVDGELELRLSPSLSGAMLSSLEYLTGYPYGCTEQTMSRFLPDVLVSRTLKSLNLRRPALEQKLPAMTQAGLMRLYSFQQGSGGWGWWQYDTPDPWMTSYVMFGLTQARQAGFEVNQRVYENGLNALREIANREITAAQEADPDAIKVSTDDRAFMAYVLALAKDGKTAQKLLRDIEPQLGKLGTRALGYRALAYAELGGSEGDRKAREGLEYLWSIAEESGGLYSWGERKKRKWDYLGPRATEITAVVLKAALAATPDDPRLAGVVRWLLLQRKADRWVSTRDTAWVLLSLSDYLKASGELNPDYRLVVKLNDGEVYSSQITSGTQEEQVIRLPKSRLAGANKVEISTTGKGTAYYALKLTQSIRTRSFAPESFNPNVSITRQYFLMESRRDGAGRLSIQPAANSGTRFKVGDRIMVRLKIKTDRPLEYLAIEDPLPSGFEVQDRGELAYDDWGYWWSSMDARDDRMSLFVRTLEPGEHELEYYLRPEQVGKPVALPTVMSDMYVPSTRVSTGETRLEVTK